MSELAKVIHRKPAQNDTRQHSHGSFVVAQLGARMHYAVPRILTQAGALERLFTDICAVKGWPRLFHLLPPSLRSAGLRRVLSRDAHGVPKNLITAFNGFGWEYARRRKHVSNHSDATAAFLWAGREFCRRVLTAGMGGSIGVYCFNCAGLEILEKARAEKRKTVIEQTIAPKRIERSLLADARAQYPDWEITCGTDDFAEEYIRREEAEWEAADLIVCGSEFVRDGIAQCGGPAQKCVVVPYGVDTHCINDNRFQQPITSEGPLKVLTVGSVGLRKGSPQVLDLAKRLKKQAQFRMVGSLTVSTVAQSSLREYVDLRGPVPRSEIAEHFAWADVFLLPSLCEGSATVTYEAIGYGLPVITTASTGSVIEHSRSGFVGRAGDIDFLEHSLLLLRHDLELRRSMSKAAFERAQEFTVERYAERLLSALRLSR